MAIFSALFLFFRSLFFSRISLATEILAICILAICIAEYDTNRNYEEEIGFGTINKSCLHS